MDDFNFNMLGNNPFHAGRILGVAAYLAGVSEEDRAVQLFDTVVNSHQVAVADAYKAYCAALDTHESAFNTLDLTRAFIKGNYDYIYGSIPREYRDDMEAELVDSNKQYSDLIGWIQTWNTNTPRT